MNKTGNNHNCLKCEKEFYVSLWREKINKGLYCSRSCADLAKSGVSILNSGQFKKGVKHTDEWKQKISELHKGSNAYQWKGIMANYTTLHQWVYKNLGKATWCSHCMSTLKIQWANISHQYKRNLNDWMQLCQKCHIKYDKGRNDKDLYFNGDRRIAI